MKRLFIVFTILIVSFTSCKNNDTIDNAWRDANINVYNSIAKNRDYQELKTESGPSGVFYKVLKTGNGTEHPLQTSRVKVLYKGTYYDGTIFDAGSSGNEIPVEFSLQETIRGFSFALQNMIVGDKWEVWIPYYLGYGATGRIDPNTYQTTIKGYTTLVFEVELVGITIHP